MLPPRKICDKEKTKMSGFGPSTRSRNPARSGFSPSSPMGQPTSQADAMNEHTIDAKPKKVLIDTTIEELSSTEEHLDDYEEEESDSSVDEAFQAILQVEVKAWLAEFGPKLFSLGLSQWLTKKEKKDKKPLSKSSASLLEPARKKRRT